MASVILGTDTDTGEVVRIGDIERRSGLYILGKPGMGKSALSVNVALQDIQNGHGLFFLDPHGDAAVDLIRRLSPDDLKRRASFPSYGRMTRFLPTTHRRMTEKMS